jgi:predicted metal-dependent enzyme (double-stranded beta helix superfamily)
LSGNPHPIHPLLAPLARAAKEVTRARAADSPERLAGELRVALRESKAWLRPEHRVGDPNGYMRHLLYTDADGDFVITAITWLPGQCSAVHGHRVWCAFGVVEGELSEEQFRVAPGEAPELLKTTVYRAGDPADQDLDGALVHRVLNRGPAPMVSLHLYGVPADKLTTGINRVYA